MRKSFTILPASICVALALSMTAAQAADNNSREIDWAAELQLSAEQQQQINAIEEGYRDKRKQLMREECTQQAKQLRELQHNMRSEVRALLTAEQAHKSDEVVRKQHSHMQLRHAREVAKKLKLSEDQRERLLADVAAMHEDYRWPLDIDQREQARASFEAVLNQHLTAEQRKRWAALKTNAKHKWHKSEEFGSGCGVDKSANRHPNKKGEA